MQTSAGGRERRVHPRISREQLTLDAQIRIPSRPPISLVDLSSGGALIDLPFQIRPDSQVNLELVTRSDRLTVPVRLLRCYVASLTGGVRYQAAGEFRERLQLPELLAAGTQAATTNRLASTLEAFLRQDGHGGGHHRVHEFNHLLGAVLEGVRRGEPPDQISWEIRSRIMHFIPSLAIEPADGAYLPDPSRGARFFGIDFRAPRVLSAVDRRMLRAAAQLLSIIDADRTAAPMPPLHPASATVETAAPEIIHSIAEWQMCRS